MLHRYDPAIQKENAGEHTRFPRVCIIQKRRAIYTIKIAFFFNSLSRGKILRAIFCCGQFARGNIKRGVRDRHARRAR